MKTKTADPRITPASRREAHIQYIMAFIGGYLGTYSVITVAETFGNAQTMNLMKMVHAAVAQQWPLAFQLFLGAVFYALGVMLHTILANRTKVPLKILSLIFDLLLGIVIPFLPENLPPLVYVYPVFFVMSFQYCCFPGAYGYGASTIFCSNNFRQMISALTEATVNKKSEFFLKFRFYGAMLLSFYAASALAFFLFLNFGTPVFALVIIPVAAAFILLIKKQRG